ncbi:MAG: transcription-repair coupling factor [Microscillaceae bacterium]|nr:transcription-repair coupling factor [Microscillaceae bacterium]MDW8460935.1 transcription-repair coupling factor [Cytophagales bacterium]
MKIKELIQLYQRDSLTQTVGKYLQSPQPEVLHLKGLVGSLDAIVVAALIHSEHATQKEQRIHLFVMSNKDEAYYFYNDLQNLLPDKKIFIFPTSYKRPYCYEEIENANVLQRAEVLGVISQATKNNEQILIVSYPEAVIEKVINRKSLVENTFTARVGEKVDIEFLTDLLLSYDFKKVDFVYEAGEFAVRGGIIDIYSFAYELPYRIELFGDEIESIRIFDPKNQLSIEKAPYLIILPNVHTRLTQAVREAFLDFIPKNTRIWCKNIANLLEITEKTYQKAEQSFQEITQATDIQLVKNPELLFETRKTFEQKLSTLFRIEFGKHFYYSSTYTIQFEATSQPSFLKKFDLLVENLQEYQHKGYLNIITAESFKQIERLRTIFDELNADLQFQSVAIGLREGFIDHLQKVVCYTDHQIFERYYRYRVKEKYSRSKALTIKELQSLQVGDFVTHIDYGIGRFAGLEKIEINGKMQEVIRLVYRDDDLLYVNLHALHKISKYSSKDGKPPNIHKLGSPEWETKKSRVKRRIQEIARELIELYAKRKISKGYAFSKDSFLQAELESSFLYEDTPDQAAATAAVKADMEKPYPMDRLICGDVGFGKTEIAIRAAFKAVCDNKQVAVLVPTTILAMQHYKTFKERLANFPCKVEYINRFKTAQQIRETLQRVRTGETNILIGTHRMVAKDVVFKDLGLVIIDEEQKFGVRVKDKLKEIKPNVDVLTLTATPIPRTLQFSLMGARDLSIITTPPPNRQPVTTELHVFDEEIIRDAISYELKRGGQVFFVHNRVSDIESIANIVFKLVPDARIGIAHGQMEGQKLEKVMLKFIEGEYDVLVTTNIIESGLDIPNANTIIINQAHTFGLADLHQMRGRVGRSNRKAYCYLLAPAHALLGTDASKRLAALEEFSELGDGFKIAMRDLDIRGAGNLLGAEQSGFINDLGFETYHKILDEAISELKEKDFRELFFGDETQTLVNIANQISPDCNIETDLEMLIPETYISSISERLSLYSKLDNIQDEEGLQQFCQNLEDRFGKPPASVHTLIETVRLRWEAKKLGFERLTLKNNTLRGYFVNKDEYFSSDTFGKVLQFVQQNPKKAALKEVNGKPLIIFQNITEIQQAVSLLKEITETSKQVVLH